MKNVKIIIEKTKILEDVRMQTAYAGAKSGDDKGIFLKVAALRSDDELLTGFWRGLCGRITDVLKDFNLVADISDQRMEISLELSGSYDETLTPSVASDIESAIASGVTARWFSITCPEKVAEYEALAEGKIRSFVGKLCHRKRPVRHG